MESNYSVIMRHVAFHEGGYTNNPKDPGKATNKGIIQSVYDSWRRTKGLLSRHVKMIDQAEVEEIYRTRYWGLINGAQLPSGVDYVVMDGAVNSGVSQSGKWLQRAINKMPSNRAPIKDDGEIGPTTIDRADDYNAETLIDEILNQRLGMLRIIRHKETGELLWGTFGEGWTNRIEGYKDRTGKRSGGVRQWGKQIARSSPVTVNAEKPIVPSYPQEKPGTGPVPFVLAVIVAVIFALWKALT